MTEFPEGLISALRQYNGVLVVSGSRHWEHHEHDFAHTRAYQVIMSAQHHNLAIICGDASGFDAHVIMEAIKYHESSRLFMLGCAINGRMRAMTPAAAHTFYVPGGTFKTCYIIRDQAMIDLALQHPGKRSFSGCWNGSSRGTIKTAEFAHRAGIRGLIYHINGDRYLLEDYFK